MFALVVSPMTDVTRILHAIEQGDSTAAAQLLPLVYGELRQLAARKLALEKPGQTLEATALVHDAYLAEAMEAVAIGSHVSDPCNEGPQCVAS
jgi:hypothetical protein